MDTKCVGTHAKEQTQQKQPESSLHWVKVNVTCEYIFLYVFAKTYTPWRGAREAALLRCGCVR
jgi:hypothetical protein